jgi:ribosome-associated toxin RatA of RatAB toxin-antitoxin module
MASTHHRIGLAALSAALFLAPCLAAPARAAEQFSIEAEAEDGAVSIRIKALVHAHYPVIWGTLTDYDQLAQFVPGMKSSRTIERRGPVAVVEQKGVAEVLIFSYPIEVTVESTESPPDSIGVRVLKGNLKRLDGGYRLERVPGSETGHMLSWRGVIEPSFSLPSLLTVPLMRSTLQRHFQAMLREIERREALAYPPPPLLVAPAGTPGAPAVAPPSGPPAATPGT